MASSCQGACCTKTRDRSRCTVTNRESCVLLPPEYLLCKDVTLKVGQGSLPCNCRTRLAVRSYSCLNRPCASTAARRGSNTTAMQQCITHGRFLVCHASTLWRHVVADAHNKRRPANRRHETSRWWSHCPSQIESTRRRLTEWTCGF